MPSGDGRHKLALRGLAGAVALVISVALLGAALQWASVVRSVQRTAERDARADCRQGENCDEKALRLQASELVTTEALFDLAFYQSLMNAAGLILLGLTVYYAHKAWRAAHDTLEDGRQGAAEQAKRFSEELKLAQANLEIAKQAAVSADRAWLRVTVTPESGVSFSEEEVSLNARVEIENVGKGPAIGVSPTRELTAKPAELDSEIRRYVSGKRLLVGRLGAVMFPGEKHVWRGELSMEREAFIEAIAKNERDGLAGAYPIIAAGVQYGLPGDDESRATYVYLYLARKGAQVDSFDGSTCHVDLKDLDFGADILSGPVR